MKFVKVLSIAALLCTSTAALALPSQAAPFFQTGSNAACAPNVHASNHVGFNPYINTGFNTSYNNNRFHTGYNTGYNTGFNGAFYNGSGIDNQIQRGIANGSINRREADRLIRDNNELQRLRSRLAMNGLSLNERARLNSAAARLEQQVRLSMTNNNGRRFW
jgi:hypothetical protein